MKRASYREGVEWIAHNDDWDPVTVKEVSTLISVVLLADLFGVAPERVAQDVVRSRLRIRSATP